MGGAHHPRSAVDIVLAQWPILIFVPTIVVVLVVLILVTRWWDRRDARLAGKPVVKRAGVGARSLRPWRMRTRCNCSWHAVGVGVARSAGDRRARPSSVG